MTQIEWNIVHALRDDNYVFQILDHVSNTQFIKDVGILGAHVRNDYFRSPDTFQDVLNYVASTKDIIRSGAGEVNRWFFQSAYDASENPVEGFGKRHQNKTFRVFSDQFCVLKKAFWVHCRFSLMSLEY